MKVLKLTASLLGIILMWLTASVICYYGINHGSSKGLELGVGAIVGAFVGSVFVVAYLKDELQHD